MIRAVLDTNVIISGTISPRGKPAAILDAWHAEYLEVVACPALIEEISEKLRLPRIRDKYSVGEAEINRLLLRFSEVARLVPGQAPVVPPPPDPDDTMLFAAAVEAEADYIVTGDKVLFDFVWNGPGKVVNPPQFWEELRRRPVFDLSLPVIILDDLSGSRFQTIESDGQTCLALFTSQEIAERYCRQNNVLAQNRLLPERGALIDCLTRVGASGCEWVAFNPVRDIAMYQRIPTMLEELRKGENGG